MKLGAGLLKSGKAFGVLGVFFKAGSYGLGQGKREGKIVGTEDTELVGEVCRWVNYRDFWWLA